MTLFNFSEQTKDIETVSRYNGGWLKSVSGLDKSKTNGYSILGEFVQAGDYKMDYADGLYLDCSKEGSRKNQKWNYHLFKVTKDGFELLQTLENGKRTWACEFWEKIEEELNNTKSSDEITTDTIINMIYEQTRDKKILAEIYEKIGKDLGVNENKEYYLSGTFNRKATKKDFEGFLRMNDLIKVTDKGLNQFEEKAIKKINERMDSDIVPEKEWESALLIAKLYCLIGADFDMKRGDYSRVWYDEIDTFKIQGYFYEYEENKYFLITKNLDEVASAKVELRG